MKKRKMLTFDIIGQLTIKILASVFLFFCAGMLLNGFFKHTETAQGEFVMLVFVSVFIIGGCVGIYQTIQQYRRYRHDYPQKRDY